MKLIEIISKGANEYVCLIWVNSKEDISDTIEGLPEGIELAPGSMIYTSTLEMGVLNEDKEWSWK